MPASCAWARFWSAGRARKLRLGTILERWPRLLAHLQDVLERFLTVVQCADQSASDDGTWEARPQPTRVGASRVAGVQVTSEPLGAVMTAVVALATQPGGFTSGQLATRVQERLRCAPAAYQPRQAAYDLKKLRGKHLVDKTAGSRRYQSSPEGLRTLVAVGILRHKGFKPVLRNRNTQGQHTRSQDPLDQHYHNLRPEMRRLFRTLKIASQAHRQQIVDATPVSA